MVPEFPHFELFIWPSLQYTGFLCSDGHKRQIWCRTTCESAPNNETETMHHCTVSVQNTEGKKTAIKRASSVTYYLRTPNASVIRTDFHCLAIDNPRMRLDLDKLLSSVHFNTKLQQNRKPCFHDWTVLGNIAFLLRICKTSLDLRVRPSALRSYFNRKRHSVWGWIPISFLNKAIALVQSWHKGKDFSFPAKSFQTFPNKRF